MTRFLILTLTCLTLGSAGVQAGSIQYDVIVNTGAIATPGFIEFQFNQANASGSLAATARLESFRFTGFTLDDGASGGTGGVTGTLLAPPVVIPNDAGGANYYHIAVVNWGSRFGFRVTLSGDAIGGSAPDGSGFFVLLLDAGFSPIVSPLPSGEIVNILVGPDGTTSLQGSTWDGGSARATPEPSGVLLALSGLSLAAFRRFRNVRG